MSIRGIGHRGYPAKYPENTMSSFHAAIELGFTHIELDVHLSKDGIPVVMHDYKIDRMTNGSGEIKNYNLDELKQFKIHEKETIPTLEEVLYLAKNKVTVSIEMKNTKLYDSLEENVFQVIQQMEMLDQVYVISFNHHSLMKLRSLSKDIKIGPLVNKMKRSHFRLINKLNAEYLAVKHDGIRDKYVKRFDELGVQVVAWTVNSIEQMQRFNKYPSILITTDELERYKNFKSSNDITEFNKAIV
ncbi:glycerophosphoryl diester phosphodiesterase [Virgibacillus pantothenticus]|uniref:Glycerophosphodiester phosphodiesterase n=1 Tax=Virgibacillus pantothenticus TaxID=1473 RepID=A0A0L0QSC4_VIRPA|nr:MULTISPECIES: glycerophosphodiester phosphodiesterase family protein [Virgibacillus]API91775.1 glycerophosphodiester phosphodiesterase [Virgibacillus sp. 6R]KNE21585.1 glycerophosphodiester phosphodiesterase [Virgibacillus pantothenticus]MBS7427897.1 glycerophosphodiester phosphodiesterase [Virgibacillus sp. 19R1-5]MED3738245.1 glycerophosphodiester phosphodiesterase family protein [Virgibacillus pantothenticus]QTY15990.1 glycerophosphodiester phosphodiesterase [Virgibacillus pantothenticus